ncbi:HNH endonuclease [Marinobacter salarius]|uniref:HNH endonuclease n=1 Tax=Marinobacter salarius TaxID=1420917 RepID=UPI003BA8D139
MKNEINQEYLRECFEYIDGILYWKERPRNHFSNDGTWKTWNLKFAGKIAGCNSYYNEGKACYWKISIDDKRYRRSRLVYIFHNGSITDNLIIDHISGESLDDRFENLRAITQYENCYNSKLYSNNCSGVTGVSFCNRFKKWFSYGQINKKRKQLYRGDDFFEAVCARRAYENSNNLITDRHGK